jgi:hypothetical protein
MKLVKEILYEKFTEEDSDPLKDMGIGAKFVYYRLYKSDQHFYTMYIYGDSYNVRDILKKYNFKWSDVNYAWKSKFSLPKELWEKSAPKMFEEIEKIGDHVVQHKGKLSKFDIDMERSFFIPGYDHWEYPPIPDGNGLKVYFKQWHHHAPVIGVTGKGTYAGRAVLKYDGYVFNKGSHMWERTYDREDVDDLIKYFESRGYTVIDGRRKLQEKFVEQSDPVEDMGIGLKKVIIDNAVAMFKESQYNDDVGIGMEGFRIIEIAFDEFSIEIITNYPVEEYLVKDWIIDEFKLRGLDEFFEIETSITYDIGDDNIYWRIDFKEKYEMIFQSKDHFVINYKTVNEIS